jgi:hypothetical protein
MPFGTHSGAMERIIRAISEAVSSQLPGRTNGPADAYRHLLWAAELTRRFGEAKARELLELHEEMGELKGDRADEIAMDRYNNELGIAIGREARDWAGVVARARLMMSAASQDGSGDYARRKPHHAGSDESAPMWLDSERWSNNPVREGGEDRLPTDETNWYTNPNRGRIDWIGGYLPDAYTSEGGYRYGGSNETFDPADPNDDLDRFIDRYRGKIEELRENDEEESALPVPIRTVAESDGSPHVVPHLKDATEERSPRRARELINLMHDLQEVDGSADSLLLRSPESWSREELEEVMSSPGYRGFGLEGSPDVKRAVAQWFGAHHGDRGKVARRHAGRTATHRCKRRRQNPSVKRPESLVAPEQKCIGR